MPEGDTIHRAAGALRRALAGKRLVRAHSAVIPTQSISGVEVKSVESRGKNLLIHLEGERVLYTHLRMSGSWHIYRQGEKWHKPERHARLTLETDDLVAVCFSAPVVELLRRRDIDRHRILGRLGPDLLDARFDVDEAMTRLRAREHLPLGEAVMVQSAVAGIGNVYKSEVLFLCGLDPFSTLSVVSDHELRRLLKTARDLLRSNLTPAPRRTRGHATGGSRLWVYGRSGLPCPRCQTRIGMRRQGLDARSTYWCPRCQAPATAPA